MICSLQAREGLEMAHSELDSIEEKFSEVAQAVRERLEGWLQMVDAEDLRRVEEEVAALMRGAGDALMAMVLERVTGDPVFEAVTVAAAMSGERPMRRAGRRHIKVTLLGGTTITLPRQQYVKPQPVRRRGPRRKPGQRGKAGAGLYPVLSALGIEWGVTPALAAEVARQVAASESFRPALESLKSRGIDLGYKPTMRIVNNFGKRAVGLRHQWVEDVHGGRARCAPVLRGKRVVVGVDGGRVRTRVPKRFGPPRKNGHRRFDTPWREPKLFVIYVIDEQGQVENAFRPVYDGTLQDADGMFRLLAAYLKALGAAEAAEVLFVGDGAEWIWNRVPGLVAELGIPAENVVELVDWYHAVEYLAETAGQASHWTEQSRSRWLKEVETQLWQGRTDDVAAAICALAVASGVAAIADRAAYFNENRSRMAYKACRRRHLPIGSGATESAIRRVINLRLKGNSKFWLEDNAEGMLMLRSYLKAGRFDDLVAWSSCAGKTWWENLAWQDPLGLDAFSDPPAARAAAA